MSATGERDAALAILGAAQSPYREVAAGYVARVGREVCATFHGWYRFWAEQLGLSSDPDDFEHHYDWRAAWMDGATPDCSGHWPSEFKRAGHPNRYIDLGGGLLLDSKTGDRYGKIQ